MRRSQVRMSSWRNPSACETRIPVSANSANNSRSRSRDCARRIAAICDSVSVLGSSLTTRNRP